MNRILVGIIFSLFITTGYIAFLVYDRQQELQKLGNDSNLLIVFYVQIMPDDFVMQLHRF
ncbi:diguanylate cyclase/phosphodiesterase [Enterobacter hormaechei]|nr:diguanylate cyclase/phosphodiesterase [Enterobacter hormaechei]